MKLITKEDLAVGDMNNSDMLDRKSLPIGRKEFDSWSDRIIEVASVTAEKESQKFSLAAMLMHLGPTEAFKEDAFFALSLRKAAVNQTAHSMMEELKEAREKKQAEATAPTLGVDGGTVLEKKEF